MKKYNNSENKIQEVPTSCQFYVVEQYKDLLKDDFVADKLFIVSEIKYCINKLKMKRIS